ncbi:MAG: amidohydrolase family protein [Planctomycetes bacterium]|nr:amidohydrolase family protein [Planctomycetota bacterium]
MNRSGQPRLRRLLPDAVLVDASTLVRGQALVVDGGRVVGLDDPIHPEVERFPGELWCAAPVMAHAHLESFDAPAATWPRTGFAAWAEALVEWRRGPRRDDAESADATLDLLGRGGCGLVLAHVGGELGSESAAAAGRGRPELICLRELFQPDPELAEAALAEARGAPVALHSPFGVSSDLARRAFAAGGLISIHLGEHPEERQFLATGAGPLADLFRRRDRPVARQRWDSPVDWLEDVGGARRGTLAVHCGDLGAAELTRLHVAEVGLVWCPGTHRWFQRPPPAFLDADGPLPALGCDSLASNETLDPMREFRLAHAALPAAGAQAWWRAATETGARLLGREELGHLRPGADCRCLRFRPGRSLASAAEACSLLSAVPPLRPLGPAGLPA